ncbi:TIGR02452 family protein [Kitasatospora sp. NBC_01250]|uniref:TIGR02452 family protein n=1 Tax=unclassified Kitasatospora TaxID=2633591 RepID=UPI002E161FD3|nr:MULTISPECIES: TIGR02452 family protein [unclassified Kitasatospora]WSJ68567.1 TIGR02452 family protein [Kitasatospora sp. NBC_01302]
MSGRLHQVARENEEIAERGGYREPGGATVTIGGLLAAARAGTVSYGPDGPDGPTGGRGTVVPGPGRPAIEVTAEGSLEAAARLVALGGPEARVGVLNFASARNPGGGYLRGAKAQEEDVCRTALLYQCLLAAPDYYAAHRASDDLRYSHRVVFSPDVPVIRDGRGALLARPYPVSFLTSAAPNAGELAVRGQGEDLAEVLRERAARVLAVAARHELRQLVLGAWGCGVFRNDPVQVAEAFAVALESFGAAFERVVFAVWDRARVSANRAAFEARFGVPDGGA